MPQASVGYEMDTIILYPTGANGITVLSNTRLQLNKEALKKNRVYACHICRARYKYKK